MKKCSVCGKEVEDNVLLCPECGSYVDRNVSYEEKKEEKPETPVTPVEPVQEESAAPRVFAILCLVFGLLGGLAAVVMGILGLVYDKKKKYTAYYIVGMVIAIVWVVIYIALVVTGALNFEKLLSY